MNNIEQVTTRTKMQYTNLYWPNKRAWRLRTFTYEVSDDGLVHLKGAPSEALQLLQQLHEYYPKILTGEPPSEGEVTLREEFSLLMLSGPDRFAYDTYHLIDAAHTPIAFTPYSTMSDLLEKDEGEGNKTYLVTVCENTEHDIFSVPSERYTTYQIAPDGNILSVYSPWGENSKNWNFQVESKFRIDFEKGEE